jgi:predicted dehydrogenase
MDSIGIGLIGTGFMGKAHALAFRTVHAVFGDVPVPRLRVLCDLPADRAERFRAQFGFERATDDWRTVVADPAVDVVSITTPNGLHAAMALAALAAGKAVYCEKPMAVTLADARAMAAADRAGRTLVGYNYLHNPAVAHAKHLIDAGAVGRVAHFRGVVDEDYMADGSLPWSWRCRTDAAGLGALGDLGCHLVSVAHHLVGRVVSLVADRQVVHAERPLPEGGVGTVENEDIATALVHFAGGGQGVLATSRVAWGRKNRLAWEVHGDRGTIAFDQERMNELQLFDARDPVALHGFKTILTGPAHPPYGAFVPAPGHGLGFGDQKVVEVYRLLRGLIGAEPLYPSFADALQIEEVIHAIDRSARADGGRVDVGGGT